MQGLINPGAAVLFLGRFGCGGQRRGQSRVLISPWWEKRQVLWSSLSLLSMISLFKFESVGSYMDGDQPSSPNQGHKTHIESMWATPAATVISRPHLPLTCPKPLVILMENMSIKYEHD